MKRLQAALAYLNFLISAGWEFPDAQFKAQQKHRVDAEALKNLYDAQRQK